MSKTIEKFLEFNGNRITLLTKDGTWWIAVKPICETLNIDYNRQFQNIKDDLTLCELFAKQQTIGSDGKLREMICMPEKYIYGWLFSIKSDSEDLKKYKLKCYDVLYNHFHGTITGRINALNEKTEMLEKVAELKEEIETSEKMQELKDLQKRIKDVDKTLKNLDTDLMSGQLTLF